MQHREQGQPEVHLGFSNKGIKHLKPQTRFCFRLCFLQNRSLCAWLSFTLPKRLWKRITKLAPTASLCWNHRSWHLAGSHPRMQTWDGGRGGSWGRIWARGSTVVVLTALPVPPLLALQALGSWQ